MRLVYTIVLLFSAMCMVAATGCAVSRAPRTEQPGTAIQDQQKEYWWFARFRMNWPTATKPEWAVDLLIADKIVEPVLIAFRPDIRLWRFHRRAVQDSTGHQFSFIFYSDTATAIGIFDSLSGSPILQKLKRNGIVRDFLVDDVGEDRPTAISATSDRNWSEALQSAWPHYIMGVSAMWMSLINQYAPEIDVEDIPTGNLIADYQAVNDKLGRTWRVEAEHALFHHLNALFGYEPLDLHMKVRF